MGTAGLLSTLTRKVLNTDIVAGVSRLCLIDVEVTCYEPSGVHGRHRKSRRVVEIVEAVVDSAASNAAHVGVTST